MSVTDPALLTQRKRQPLHGWRFVLWGARLSERLLALSAFWPFAEVLALKLFEVRKPPELARADPDGRRDGAVLLPSQDIAVAGGVPRAQFARGQKHLVGGIVGHCWLHAKPGPPKCGIGGTSRHLVQAWPAIKAKNCE